MTRAPFKRYGGKFYMLGTILPLLPAHELWVEAFCGAAWVTLAKRPAPVEVINDLDDGVATFYRVLRDPVQSEALRAALELTPYARAEYRECRSTWQAQCDPVEKARRWFVAARQSMQGDYRTAGWCYSRDPDAYPPLSWMGAIEGLPAVHRRLRRVQIEHQDWRKLLPTWNVPGCLLYCDPPYVLDTRRGGERYTLEMTDDDHRDLVAALLDWRGHALVSGYRHPIYAPLEGAGWHRLDIDVIAAGTGTTRSSAVKQRRVESIWLSYDPAQAHGQMPLGLEAI